MPDQEHTVVVLVTMKVYGNQEQADKLALSIARAVHYGVKPGALVERVIITPADPGYGTPYPEILMREVVPFDAVLDDGHPGPDYVSPLCTCSVVGRNAAAMVVNNPNCPQHGNA
jgi:hypothetical protein